MTHHNTRVIVALDFSSREEALALVERLHPSLCQLKVGLTLYTLLGPAFVELLMKKGFLVFLDLKFHDIPYQVAGACRVAAMLGVWMLTIHTLGGIKMCEAAAEALSHFKQAPLLLGVTVLTSCQQEELAAIGIDKPISEYVEDLAEIAENASLDGVVCSPLEVPFLRVRRKSPFLLVTPGIRFEAQTKDDQSRVMTPQQAFQRGSDYIVIGRALARAQDPIALLKEIAQSKLG